MWMNPPEKGEALGDKGAGDIIAHNVSHLWTERSRELHPPTAAVAS